MGIFRTCLDYASNVKERLSSSAHLSNKLDRKVYKYEKVGTLIRDGLAKPISSSIMTGLGFDGDVEGVDDVKPDKPDKKDDISE